MNLNRYMKLSYSIRFKFYIFKDTIILEVLSESK